MLFVLVVEQVASSPPVRVGMISLGCAKNLVDAEIMVGTLMQDGVEITNNPEEADVVIVNTCSFIDSAQEESVDAILESNQLRDRVKAEQGLVVSGCLPQRFREELPALLPEVDAFMGIDQVAQVTDIVKRALQNRRLKDLPRGKSRKKPASPAPSPAPAPIFEVTERPQYIPDYVTPRFRLTPRHFAYLKIAEGCNHPCSFCIIPRMRGSHRSRQPADVVAEARSLVADGVREINLISQDSTYYGLDLRPNHTRAISSPQKFKAAVDSLPANSTTISGLLRELNAIEGDFWVRLLYTHPAHWTDELIETIAACRKVAKYVDIPLQHIHDNMLERMRRETSRQHIVDLLARIRQGIPGIALRTTFIVGFPGETEAYFQSLLDFMAEVRFERLGVFMYSQEQGTRAGSMAGQIPEALRLERRDRAMALQKQIAADIGAGFVGKTLRVLVEREASAQDLPLARIKSWERSHIRPASQIATKAGWVVARGEADAPDIDGRIYVRGPLPAGEFAQVRILAHHEYDLIAEPA